MSKYLPQCHKVTDDEISCSDWCYGIPDAEQPNHVCENLFIGSIDHYIAAHLGLMELEYSYSLRWPAPMGVQELRKWYEEQETQCDRLSKFPYVSTEFHQRWNVVFTGPPPSQDDERLELFDDFLPEQVMAFQRWSYEMVAEPPPIPPWWSTPLVTIPSGEYWLGFVVRRPVGDSTLWLLGLLGRPEPGKFTGHNWFVWIHPVLQIESRAIKGGDLDNLNKKSKKLVQWYNNMLFGEPIHEGGPSGYFDNPPEFIEALEIAVRTITRQSPRVTQEGVAQRMYISEKTLRNYLDKVKKLDPPLEWKQVRVLKQLREYTPPPDWN